MKNWIIALVIIVLAAGTGTNGYLYLQTSDGLRNAQSEIASLKADASALRASLAQTDGNLKDAQSRISSAETGISALEFNLAQTGSGLKDAQSQIASVKTDVSSLQTSLAQTDNSLKNAQAQLLDVKTEISRFANVQQALDVTAKSIVDKIEPVLVRINVGGIGFQAAGSGFLVSGNGYVLTNNHVIDGATSIRITLNDGQRFSASIIDSNGTRDLALLKIASTRTDFPRAELGSSSGAAVGQGVIAAGFPLGTDLPGPATYTRGIISAFRTIRNLKYIQMDAAISPGNSGGVLVDFGGKVIGIVSAVVMPGNPEVEGLGLAIPMDEARAFIQRTIGQ
ncbi:MAG: trypsin-like peptidase domain-containing protein [Chloroflexi bacterium]|nr:trypsin-like peptidase domain-containing protein [Chloroflexota bacterium]